MEEIFSFIKSFFENNETLAIALTPFTGRELGVHMLGVFYTWNIYPMWKIYVIPLIAIMCMDSIWFLGFRYILKDFFNKMQKKYNMVAFEKLNRISKGNELYLLILAKGVPGMRLLTIGYLSTLERVRYRHFIVYTTIATGIWNTIYVTSGILVGKSILTLSSEQFLQLVAIYVSFLIVVMISLRIYLRRKT